MGSRDYRHRETKKPKKGAKKAAPIYLLPTTPVEVEVIRKKKKEQEVEEKES